MSRRFWTADMHLGSKLITEYAGRPFKSAQHAVDRLIANANSRVKADDRVVHVGDFCTYGKAQGAEGLRIKAEEYLKQLNGKWTLLQGNHDSQNHTKTIGMLMVAEIGKYKAFVCHYPTDPVYDAEVEEAYGLRSGEWTRMLHHLVESSVDFAICGHVHSAWSVNARGGIVNVNVGVDSFKYRPMTDDEVIVRYETYTRSLERALGELPNEVLSGSLEHHDVGSATGEGSGGTGQTSCQG